MWAGEIGTARRHCLNLDPSAHSRVESPAVPGLHLPSGFPAGSEGKVSACNAGDLGSIRGSGRSPGDVSGNPLQYSCLENPMNRGAW